MSLSSLPVEKRLGHETGALERPLRPLTLFHQNRMSTSDLSHCLLGLHHRSNIDFDLGKDPAQVEFVVVDRHAEPKNLLPESPNGRKYKREI